MNLNSHAGGFQARGSYHSDHEHGDHCGDDYGKEVDLYVDGRFVAFTTTGPDGSYSLLTGKPVQG